MKKVGLIWYCSLFFCYSGFAQSINKRINFSVKEMPLPAALVQLSLQSNIPISFSENFFDASSHVTIDVKMERIKTILMILLEGLDIDFKINQNDIILFLKEPPPPKFTISGYIEDEQTGERLIAANIIDLFSGKGAISNNYGFFSLTLPQGRINLNFSFLGYQNQEISLLLEKNTKLKISLVPSLTLTQVVVVARDSFQLKHLKTRGDELPLDLLKAFPQLGGEGDVMRFTHMLPGVQTGADGVGGIHIRGGNADQNMILLDGVPVYNATHAVGVFSIFNSSAVRSARLLKGDFPARYAGRLSSVLDIRTKEGNQKSIAAELKTGVMGGRATLEGPLVKDKGAFFLAGRHSYLNLWLKPYIRRNKEDRNSLGNLNYDFYDINAKINYSLTEKDKLFLSLYKGKDDFFDETFAQDTFILKTGEIRYSDTLSQKLNWGNTIGAFRWNREWNEKVFSNLSLTFSNYQFTSQDLFNLNDFELPSNAAISREVAFQQFQSTIEDWGAKIDFDFQPGNQHNFLFGGSFTRHKFQPGVLTTEEFSNLSAVNDTIFQSASNLSYESGIYLEDIIEFNKKWSANLGVHLSQLHVEDADYWALQPRFSIQYQPISDLLFRLSGGRMTQYLHLLTNSDFGLPTDLWVPSTKTIQPEEAWQADFKMEVQFFKTLDFSIDVYYKKLKNMLTFQTGSSLAFIDANNWEERVTAGEGEGYGVEFQLKKMQGNSKAWLNYTLAWSNRQFEGINGGFSYPFKYDRRHNIKLVLSHKLNENTNVTANWVYGTGLAFTLATSAFEYIQAPDFIVYNVNQVDQKNNLRLPAYHRFDIGINKYFRGKKSTHIAHIGVYNLYNKANPLYYRLGRDPDDFFRKRFVKVSVLPVFPNLSYTFKLY